MGPVVLSLDASALACLLCTPARAPASWLWLLPWVLQPLQQPCAFPDPVCVCNISHLSASLYMPQRVFGTASASERSAVCVCVYQDELDTLISWGRRMSPPTLGAYICVQNEHPCAWVYTPGVCLSLCWAVHLHSMACQLRHLCMAGRGCSGPASISLHLCWLRCLCCPRCGSCHNLSA